MTMLVGNNNNSYIDIKFLNQNLNAEEVTTQLMGIPPSEIKKTAEGIRFHCPLHGGNKRYSLTINLSTNKFYCQNYACGEKGDIVNLYAKYKRIDDVAAAKELANYFQINESSMQATNSKNTFTPAQKTIPTKNIRVPQEAWEEAKEDGNHDYFIKKEINPCSGVRYGNDEKGNYSIAVPFYNIETGVLQSIQYIHEKGKFFLTGSETKGCAFFINDPQLADTLYVGEGLATLKTIDEALQATQASFISCGSSSNIPYNLELLRKQYPQKKIIVCLDDDSAGENIEKQVKKSGYTDILFIKPNFNIEGIIRKEDDADFNDLMILLKKNGFDSKDTIKKQILQATAIQQHSSIKIQFISQMPKNWLLEDAPPAPALINIMKNDKSEIFLRKGIVGQVVGAGGVGKTHFLAQLSLSVASGTTFLEEFNIAKKGYVFLALGENSEDDIHRLLRKMVKKLFTEESVLKDTSNHLAVMSFNGKHSPFINKDGSPSKTFKEFIEQLKQNEPTDGWSLIILDPISRFLGSDAETDNAAATHFISLLERLTLELKGKPTVLFGHHMSKSSLNNENTDQTASRGSSAITDGVRWQANLSRIKDQDGNDIIKICFKVVKSNFTALSEYFLTKDDVGCFKLLDIKKKTQSSKSTSDWNK